VTEPKLRPFHETIVDAMKGATLFQLEIIIVLLETTVIPKNHDQIVTTWREQCLMLEVSFNLEEKIARIILAQKPKDTPPKLLCL